MCAKKKQPVKAPKPPVKKTGKAAKPAPAASAPLFPIAAIGGSAGGIEAISKFLAHLQPDLGIASHELRTPVTSIKAYTQLLQEMLIEKNEAESIEIIDKLDRQVDRLTHLIADLLDITRISEGQLMLQPEVYNINDLVYEIVELMQRTTPQHAIVNELQSLPPVKADRERIGQVLINLISNAIKYSPNSHRIIVSTALQKKRVKVSMQDFGIGMSEETRLRIFDRFFRASDNNIKIFPGLGLGLFIASDIIKKHGGDIGVESEKEKGTLIYFTLPVHVDKS